ncbi:MAG: uL15m family ribosomal protein [Nanoarchaeota archaeon]
MTINKRTKASRHRGSHTHGWGAKKKHRGSGNRGGRGKSSTGARSDAKRPSVWKNLNYFGKHGFKKKNNKQENLPITIKTIEQHATMWEQEKKITIQGDLSLLNLEKIGYTKLLSTGKATRKWKITIPHAVKSAITKIEHAGGSVEGSQ